MESVLNNDDNCSRMISIINAGALVYIAGIADNLHQAIAIYHVDRTIDLIKENGCKAGIVLNPATARGDLGVEIGIEQLPAVQDKLIRKAISYDKIIH